MAEYLAPGVYVEETSFRAKSIEGVGTSTTAFAGPTRKGPAGVTPELLTSFGDFERIYGGLDDLAYSGTTPRTNYLAHAVLAYFNEGGSRLYVARALGDSTAIATATALDNADPAQKVAFNARFAGAAGNATVTLAEVLTPASEKTLDTAPQGSVARTTAVDNSTTSYLKTAPGWVVPGVDGANASSVLASSKPQLVTLSVSVTDRAGAALSYDGLGFHPDHPRYVGSVLAATPSRRADALQNPVAIAVGAGVSGVALHTALLSGGKTRTLTLAGGADGNPPDAAAYAGALDVLGAIEGISIIAAPGASAYGIGQAVNNSLIAHAEARRAYRIAVLDTPAGQLVGGASEFRGLFDSTHAALYYPWVVVSNPNARPGNDSIPAEIALPPSGFVCGVYARTDVNRGVFKAPANEVVFGALRFETDVNFGQQEVLNPLGVNCLRTLPGRGNRIWGARTVSSDPEWKYVNVRRYFTYLEASIDRGTQWAVFEPNGERLWANVVQTISDFLYNEWKGGALLGTTTEQAYFVRCDRSTMTQNDLDNGRLVCLVGVAAIKPAEFVIFRIGQKTADERS